ncbi:hypothetical protein ACIRNY_03050 [Capnocytophaga canimorsus]|uniref:hypothetical protein n=1 Tax=Capnocytophaga canimorsus TaxID=28188 RepID=UPI00384E0574
MLKNNAQKWSLGSWAYEWNANGSLKKVKRPNGSVITFKYDAFGRRIEKKTARAITHFVWDGNVPLHEWKTFDYRETTDNNRITWVFQDFVLVAKRQRDLCFTNLYEKQLIFRIIPFESLLKNQDK